MITYPAGTTITFSFAKAVARSRRVDMPTASAIGKFVTGSVFTDAELDRIKHDLRLGMEAAADQIRALQVGTLRRP